MAQPAPGPLARAWVGYPREDGRGLKRPLAGASMRVSARVTGSAASDFCRVSKPLDLTSFMTFRASRASSRANACTAASSLIIEL